MNCAEVEVVLLEVAEGDAEDSLTDAVHAHLSECARCAARMRETQRTLGDLFAARSAETAVLDARHVEPEPAPTLRPGVLIGDFEVLNELGRGGMGVVYRARQRSLNRVVALKVLNAGIVTSDRAITRFRTEAQAGARLHHTNIVPVYAQGQADGHFYYAMELVDGKSLEAILAEQRAGASPTGDQTVISKRNGSGHAGGAATRILRDSASFVRSAVLSFTTHAPRHSDRRPRDFKRIARLLAEVAEGLDHAHRLGIVHRDIKPQNLLLGTDDHLHVTDFGLARILNEPGVTRTSEMVGTPAYMAPEQIVSGRTTDARTDVYGLGVTMYEMLTLTRPFEANSYDQLMHQILTRDARPPRRIDARVPADLETICLRAMEKEPARRFASARDMAQDLRRYAEDFPIHSRPVGVAGKAVRWLRRHPTGAAAIAAGLLVAVLTPLLYVATSNAATNQINVGLRVLLDDYHNGEEAEAQLGIAARLVGDDRNYHFVRAFSQLNGAPEKAVAILEELIRRHPKDVDSRYMLAWALARRTSTVGEHLWARVHQTVSEAESVGAEPSAAGWFFRGMALVADDPEEALRSLDRAIYLGNNFTQAMLHYGRTRNWLFYTTRSAEGYRDLVARLEITVQMQRDQAYPRYILAITHQLAAEILAEQARLETDPEMQESRIRDAEKAYADSHTLARDAQRVEPQSIRGYAAEAGYFESYGLWKEDPAILRSAAEAWDRSRRAAHATSKRDVAERAGYAMRQRFWLGDDQAARQLHAERYSAVSGYGAMYHVDESLYAAFIAAAMGDTGGARAAARDAAERSGSDPEQALVALALANLFDADIGSSRAALEKDAQGRPETKLILACMSGSADWGELERRIPSFVARPPDEARLRALTEFIEGLSALSAGRVDVALSALDAAAARYDAEGYCFRAKFIAVRLRLDPRFCSLFQK